MPRFASPRLGFFGFRPQIIDTLQIFELVEATAAEIGAAFAMEAYPRVLAAPRAVVHLVAEKQAAEAFVAELTLEVRQYRQIGEELFSVAENVRGCAQLGLFAKPGFLRTVLDEAVARAKARDDALSPVDGCPPCYGRERQLATILSLRPPPGGGVSEDGREGPYTATFFETLSFREVYMLEDASTQAQVDHLVRGCAFDFYEGVGALPLPVRVAAMLVNWLRARRALAEALVEGQTLQTCTYLLRQISGGTEGRTAEN